MDYVLCYQYMYMNSYLNTGTNRLGKFELRTVQKLEERLRVVGQERSAKMSVCVIICPY